MPTIYLPRRKKNNRKARSEADRKRSSEQYMQRKAVYNSTRWQKLRAWKAAASPLCERCLQHGHVVPAEDVHHIVSFMSTTDPIRRQALAYDPDNLMSLCKRCHQAIHSKEHSLNDWNTLINK